MSRLLNKNVDLNLGCPIDLVTSKGAGSALLERKSRLESILSAMKATSSVPFTVKIRTGVTMGRKTAHTLLPLFQSYGASLVTLHGRSKEQRYAKKADWEYISECAKLADPMPLFGNGDVLGWEDYYAALDKGVSGVMIGRGALIKPWLFKEIKERKVYDISATERLDIMKEFTRCGLEYWGSDTMGVNTTRR